MIIGGFTKLSTVDWPGKLAAVVFTRGCNFRCPWCHNKNLVWPELYGTELPEKEVLLYLKKRKRYLDGVVITGGEPTIQESLPAFLRKIKNIGLMVKIDTNGSNPNMLERLLKEGLLDALAVDVKAPLKKYPAVIGCFPVDLPDLLLKSFLLAAEAHIPVWFRTTLIPGLEEKDIEEIKRMVKYLKSKAAVHIFQEYREN